MHSNRSQWPRPQGYETSQGDQPPRRNRSSSLTQHNGEETERLKDRMKYSFEYSFFKYKPNTRGDVVQHPFATLQNALQDVPESVGFDIELSKSILYIVNLTLLMDHIEYSRIHESFVTNVAPIAIEVNAFVDTILTVIARYGGGRQIFLSSFSPEICILLSLKQQAYPVFFITNAGTPPAFDLDERALSLQTAVRFALRWGLAGLVFISNPLVMCPRLVSYVKRKGLVCGTYGPMNNEPKHIEVSRP
jgi:glycerophosphodiester phosphodiesterase